MGRRFSRIKQAQRLEAALTHYDTWLVAAKPTKTGTPGTKGAKGTVYIIPFNIPIGNTEVVSATALQSALTAYETALGTHVKATLPTGDSTVNLKNYRPARIQVITKGSGGATYTPSKITGQQYIKYPKTSVSIPFGATSAQTPESEGFAFSVFASNAAFTGKQTYLIAEKFSI